MDFDLERRDNLWVGQFQCMASPCEVLVDNGDQTHVRKLVSLARDEARRIEKKYSRYRQDNIVYQLNNMTDSVKVDDETADLLDFAQNCYRLSNGLFDITSGILRQAWQFLENSRIPDANTIEKLLVQIGWPKIVWEKPFLTIPRGMEIDFGGIGKEYAVDRVVGLLKSQTESPFMINFGGDCNAAAPPSHGLPWMTGIEIPGKPGMANTVVPLIRGGLATSGDGYRYIEHNGIRYGHILNPKTGWPQPDSPRSVTVAAATCTEAGILSTLAMLHGSGAETFLEEQGVSHWCYR